MPSGDPLISARPPRRERRCAAWRRWVSVLSTGFGAATGAGGGGGGGGGEDGLEITLLMLCG